MSDPMEELRLAMRRLDIKHTEDIWREEYSWPLFRFLLINAWFARLFSYPIRAVVAIVQWRRPWEDTREHEARLKRHAEIGQRLIDWSKPEARS